MIKSIQFLAVSATLAFAIQGQVQADIVFATFQDIVDNSEFGSPFVDNVSSGDAFVVIIAMDNGGSGSTSQTWNAADVVSVTYDFGNGAHTTVFDPNGGDGFSTTDGSFTTDALGQLTSVPTDWSDSSLVNVQSTNSSETPDAWFLNNLNDKYYTEGFINSMGIGSANANVIVANWTISSSVPEPSSMLLIVAGMSLCTFRRRK